MSCSIISRDTHYPLFFLFVYRERLLVFKETNKQMFPQFCFRNFSFPMPQTLHILHENKNKQTKKRRKPQQKCNLMKFLENRLRLLKTHDVKLMNSLEE